MGFKPTPEQEQAISVIDRDLIVLAGAGSGKTKVLVERYINLVEQGVQLNQILAITFTRKAALEMKDRIRQTLPSMEQAQISTIHSFCQKVVADHPRQAQIDPHFRMFEEWESKALLTKIATETVAQALYQEDEKVIRLREDFRQSKDLVDYLVRIYQEMISKGAESFTFDSATDELVKLQRQIIILRQELRASLTEWLSWIKKQKLSLSKQSVVGQVEELWSENEKGFLDLDPYSMIGLLQELASLFGGRWAKDLQEQVRAQQELCNNLAQSLIDEQGIYDLTQIGKVLEKIHKNYVRRKLAQGLLDYDDLERMAVELLAMPEVRASYDFKYILLDEAQDTNERQKKLIDLLCSDGHVKLFIVGDPKQSIYRFRGAEVDVFLEAREKIINTNGKHIFLKDNFRSRPEVVNFANHIFGQLMADDKIDYEPSEAFRESSGQPAVELLVTPKAERSLGEAREEEATRIATYIRKLTDKEGFSFSDIVMLFRSMTNVKLYEEAFQLAEIPFVNLSGRGFYEKNEIQDILNFINWLLDAKDLVSKIAVLRSPFFGISDQGLFWYQADKLEKLSKEDQDKLTQAYQLYPKLQKSLATKPAPLFIQQMLDSTDFKANTYGLPMGEQRRANIDKFIDTSWQLWNKGYVHIEEQLVYIAEAIEQEGREGEARLDNETADVVTLMTIHGSKGLEFPVVILADCSRSRHNRSGGLLYHKQEGLAIKDTTHYQKIKELEDAEEISEEKRLLYVAVTRARERLVLSGIGLEEELDLNKPFNKLNSWWEWVWAGLSEVEEDIYKVVQLEVEEDSLAVQKLDSVVSTKPDLRPTETQIPITYRVASFSVTSLMIYAQCPRRYYYRYILRVPELLQSNQSHTVSSELDPLKRGNIVHRACEHLREGQDLQELLDWAISMEGLSLNKVERNELLEIVNGYLNSSYYQKTQKKQVKHEVEFTVPLNDYFLITGAVDQVLQDANGITIMDLKTNYITPEQVEKVATSYYWQLRIYAWAINKLTEKPISKTLLYFLFPDVIYTDLDAHLLIDETEDWLKKTCSSIQKGEEQGVEAFPIKSDCTFCGYNCQQIEKAQQNFVDLLAGLGKLN